MEIGFLLQELERDFYKNEWELMEQTSYNLDMDITEFMCDCRKFLIQYKLSLNY